jgi:hypothetical protein
LEPDRPRSLRFGLNTYEKVIQGIGHCIHTYKSDGTPRPSFIGEPFILPIYNNIDDTAYTYWSNLNNENKVAILTKYIDTSSGDVEMRIINKHEL